MIAVLLLFIAFALIIYHYHTHYGKCGKLINLIPGPGITPIFGNVLQYNLPNDELWTSQRKVNAQYYPIVRLWLASIPVINVFHPDDVRLLLTNTTNIEKNLMYNFLQPWLGTGLLTSAGAKWQHRRKMLTPAFHFNILQDFTDIFVENAQKLVESLKSKEGVTKDIVPLFKIHTLKIICETAMGIQLDKVGDEKQYANAIRELGSILFYRTPKPWFHIDWIFSLSPKGQIQKKCLKTLHDFTTKIIEERRKYLKSNLNGKEDSLKKNGHVEDDVGIRKKRTAMLDILIKSAEENEIDDDGIREEVDTFVFEGHDTTAMAFIFTVALLAEHPEIQDLARKEVTELFKKSNGKIGIKEINSLDYLDRCVKESLRLYPSVATIGRAVTEDQQLKNYLIPAGSMINIHIFDLHRDPNYWPNPLVFDPDRFLPNNVQNRHPFAYVPFSAGSRNCIGQKFATLELKVLISHLLENFKMSTNAITNEIKLIQDLVITPAEPIRVKFTSIRVALVNGTCLSFCITGAYEMQFTTLALLPASQTIVRCVYELTHLHHKFIIDIFFLNMILFFLILIFGLLTIYHLTVHYGKCGRLINKIPGPKNLPIFGSVFGYMVPTDELWIAHRKINATYYPINKVWLGSTPVISIYHPDDVQILLSSFKHTEKSMLYKFLHPWLGSGLLTSSGIKWQRRRKLLTPAFHFEILRGFIHVFNKQGEILINRLKQQGEEVIQNIVPIFTECTLNSILETAMGTTLDEKSTRNLYGSAIRQISDNLFFRALRPWLHLNKIFNITPTGMKQQKLINILHGFSNQIIKNRKKDKERISRMNDDKSFADAKNSEYKMALLDILIKAAEKNPDVDDVAIREEVDTFVFEGHDTTAMGTCFTILLLAEHKEIQKIARQEVCEIFNECCGKIGMKEINQFTYLDRCVKEALRLFPGVPGIARVLHEDLQLKNYLAPAGTNIHLHIFDLHRDENFWPDPLVFDPNRFLPENVQRRHSFSYVPFSAGPRNCIGQKFAMMEIKVLVANLLFNFDMETLDSFQNIKLLQDIIIRPGQPIRVKFVQRSLPIL
ncbi:uncharacterized protein LOC122503517 [Leptopilina heterotoma]|uniref:uncharacterized protein LOC122503517 n=1 Tax=Leptopilina heterotoma TaxID=63436 RepID=UPI001CA8EC5B|nr:uncharacterized protein LOC122503517 [Leptopilina heterotoma]